MKCTDFIAVEALLIRNMIRKGKNKRGLNRAIAEQGWGELFDILKCCKRWHSRSGWDGVARSRGFRSMLYRRSRRPLAAHPCGAEERSRKRNRNLKLAQNGFEFCKSFLVLTRTGSHSDSSGNGWVLEV